MALIKQSPTFRDFDLNFIAHPVTGDLVMKNDTAAAMQSVRELVLTSSGEYLNQPEMGGDVYGMLFELGSDANIILLQQKIKDTIETYEPRVELSDLQVNRTADMHGVIINITFYILNQPTPVTQTIPLKRTR